MTVTKLTQGPRVPTFNLLDQYVAILGGTKLAFWPFLSGGGKDIVPYGVGNDGILAYASDNGGGVDLGQRFSPIPLAGGIFALYFDSSLNQHLYALNNAAFNHGNGTVDSPFSIGAWI